MNVPMELLIAALIQQEHGELFIGKEYLDSDVEGKVIAMNYDPLRDGIVMELVNEKEVIYDDE